jgi:thiamine pyrophosphate-dependent acetolactate synthase large subunit-like protein
MASRPGRIALLEQLAADGLTTLFGNPGTVEQGFLDALADHPEIRYVLALQESVAVMMADGYARAARRPAVVQLHSSPGIGNAVGALYQAKRGHAPLVVIGGDAGVRYMNLDAQMAADLVAIMEPVTKYATMVLDPRSVLRTLRRAIKIASTPPMGPVYVCLPADVLDQPTDEPVFPSCIPSTAVSPPPGLIGQAARWLLEAEHPAIYVGDGVAHSGAQAELVQVAELLGAPVWGVDVGDLDMDATHPLYQGTTGHMFGFQSLPVTRRGDVNLVVGTYMVPEVYPELGDIWGEGARVVHFDLDAYEIAKNHRVDLGVVSDPGRSLAALAGEIASLRSEAQARRAQERLDAARSAKAAREQADREADRQRFGRAPLTMAEFASALAGRLPEDAVIFDEALTNSPAVTRYLPPRRAGGYFVTRGGSLGVGFPGALGAKLAEPSRTVVGFSGDGGSMYTIQALWSAARHGLGAKLVVCNNRSYRLLQVNLQAYWSGLGIEPHAQPLCFDLSEPAIRFDELARALGVAACRVERSEEVGPALDRMLADDAPFLIDLVLEGDVHPELIGVRCGQ